MPRKKVLLPEEMWKKWAKGWMAVSFPGIEKDKGKAGGRGGAQRNRVWFWTWEMAGAWKASGGEAPQAQEGSSL